MKSLSQQILVHRGTPASRRGKPKRVFGQAHVTKKATNQTVQSIREHCERAHPYKTTKLQPDLLSAVILEMVRPVRFNVVSQRAHRLRSNQVSSVSSKGREVARSQGRTPRVYREPVLTARPIYGGWSVVSVISLSLSDDDMLRWLSTVR